MIEQSGLKVKYFKPLVTCHWLLVTPPSLLLTISSMLYLARRSLGEGGCSMHYLGRTPFFSITVGYA
jgi:hypothetical protein